MSLTFFQQYEQRRKRYEPGTIWVDKGRHTVQKLQIIDRSKLSPEIKVEELYQTGVTISFRVLEVRYEGSRLSSGVIGDWSKDYMEDNYEVLIDG
jgi:hypothetical protein